MSAIACLFYWKMVSVALDANPITQTSGIEDMGQVIDGLVWSGLIHSDISHKSLEEKKTTQECLF